MKTQTHKKYIHIHTFQKEKTFILTPNTPIQVMYINNKSSWGKINFSQKNPLLLGQQTY